jgi:hypothetical protein
LNLKFIFIRYFSTNEKDTPYRNFYVSALFYKYNSAGTIEKSAAGRHGKEMCHLPLSLDIYFLCRAPQHAACAVAGTGSGGEQGDVSVLP